MVEILAPCGGKDAFLSAVNNFADAIYLGLDNFSARKNAENFNKDNIAYYIAYAHTFNVKVYVCINTLVKTDELQSLFDTVKFAYLAQADAFIVQDIFLGKILKENFPQITLHLSTQAGVCNTYGAKLALEYGFSRVVLARETDIKEIKAISQIIETEVFVHGALCTSISGHCYLSSVIGKKSGNRGLCRQPCRQKYTYSFNGNECYALSLSDLCLVDRMKDLIDAGVSSFKIEGRMRSAEYVGATVRLYKNAVKGKVTKDDLSIAKRTFNRGNWTSGYTFGEDTKLLSTLVQGHMGESVSSVEVIRGDKIILKKPFMAGCGFKIFRNGIEVGNGITKTYGNEINFSGNIKKGDNICITKDVSLADKFSVKRLKEVDVSCEFFVGKRAKLSSCGVSVYSESELAMSRTSPISEEMVRENLLRVDIYPFKIRNVFFKGDNAFITKGELNKLRKSLFEAIFYGNTKERNVVKTSFDIPPLQKNQGRSIAIIATSWLGDFNGKVEHYIYAPTLYTSEAVDGFFEKSKGSKCKKYLYIPAFLTDGEIENIKDISKRFDGLYVESTFGLKLCQELKRSAFGGIELNNFNLFDESEIAKMCDNYCLSKELSAKEMQNMNGFVFVLGSIKVMSLAYCPNKRNCNSCSVGDLEILTDFNKRKFPVRRYKTSKCRFEIFNESIICAKKPFEKMIFDLSGLESEKAKNLLDDYFTIGFDGIAKKYKVTNYSLSFGIE